MNFEKIAKFHTIEMPTHNNHFITEAVKEKSDSCKLILAHAESPNTSHITMKSVRGRLLVRGGQVAVANVYCGGAKCVLSRSDSGL